MKKIILLSMVILFSLGTSQAYPLLKERQIKSEVDSIGAKSKKVSTEKKAERKLLKKMKISSVSNRSKVQFLEDFGHKQRAVWKRVGEYDKVFFIDKNGNRTTAVYDYDSQLMGTILHKTFLDLPLKAQNVIKEKYKEYSVAGIILLDEEDGNDPEEVVYNLAPGLDRDYFVELIKADDRIVLQVKSTGFVSCHKNR